MRGARRAAAKRDEPASWAAAAGTSGSIAYCHVSAAASLLVEVRRQMSAQIARVVARTIDECGFAPPEERDPHHVEAGALDHAAVVLDAALAIEHRHLEPGIVGTVTRGPDHRLDFAAREI